MREILLVLLSCIPIAIAICFKASDDMLLIAAAPLLLVALVVRLNRAKSLYMPAGARIGMMGVGSVLIVVGTAISMVLWSVLLSPR